MTEPVDTDLASELFDVFHVTQITRGTDLQSLVAADVVHVDPGQESSMHRHNAAETVLYILGGRGEILLHEQYEAHAVGSGDRIRIGKGVFHAVRTGDHSLQFLSVQSPPIFDDATGHEDLEPID